MALQWTTLLCTAQRDGKETRTIARKVIQKEKKTLHHGIDDEGRKGQAEGSIPAAASKQVEPTKLSHRASTTMLTTA